MHELLLFGQVPASRHEQVLSILAGVAAMQPQPFLEKHLIFKPARLPPGSRPGHTGAVQGVPNPQIQAIQAQTQGDIFYLQLVADVDITKASKDQGQRDGNLGRGENRTTEHGNPLNPNSEPITIAGEKAEPETGSEKWTLQFRDLPEVAGRRPVTSRLIYDLEFKSGDPLAFMSALDYTHVSTYFISGHRLSHISTSLLLFRPHVPLAPPSSSSAQPSSQPISSQQATLTNSRLLDPSGAYILQVALRVSDGSKPELMTRGITELLALKEMLKGVVELAVAERLSLDTRVR
ncbi:Mediator of RNA polymerase II transcription subunit 18 [Lobaria immixta]|nr:Mediator of RNA polymerase II transcription subunit 18 [Lobaria immixta]